MKSKSIIVLLLLCVSLGGSCQKQEIPPEMTPKLAISTGNIEALAGFLDQGVITKDDALGEALDWFNRNENVVRYLLENGADANSTPKWGSTGSSDNSTSDSPHLIQWVEGFAPLDMCPELPSITQLLIEHGAQTERLIEPNANTLMGYIHLMYNSRRVSWEEEIEGILQSMRLLLENGANPNFRSEAGYSPLMLALNYELREAVDLLLEFGAVPSAKPVRVDFNYDPLGFKEWDEEYGVVWQDEFLLLAGCGYHDILIPYIEKGVVTPDHATPDGHDMYYWAAEGGDPWMMVALLKYLPNVNSKRYRMGDLRGVSLLHVAAANNNEETAKVLLENGINTKINAINQDGGYVLASRVNFFEMGVELVTA